MQIQIGNFFNSIVGDVRTGVAFLTLVIGLDRKQGTEVIEV